MCSFLVAIMKQKYLSLLYSSIIQFIFIEQLYYNIIMQYAICNMQYAKLIMMFQLVFIKINICRKIPIDIN